MTYPNRAILLTLVVRVEDRPTRGCPDSGKVLLVGIPRWKPGNPEKSGMLAKENRNVGTRIFNPQHGILNLRLRLP